LLVNNDAVDVDDVNDVNDANDADADDVDDERRRRRSSIEEEKRSRLDTSLDRVERLVMCCFFASLAVSQAKSTNAFFLIELYMIFENHHFYDLESFRRH
jgi:hypothetical protein